MRGQANLLAVTVALLLVVTSAVVGAAVLNGAVAAATGDPADRRVAAAAAARLTSPAGPLASRANVVPAAAVADLDGATLRETVPEADLRVRVDGETVATTGDPTGGRTVRRLVLVTSERRLRRRRPTRAEAGARLVTLPAAADRAVVTVGRGPNASTEALRVNGRTAWANDSGLVGRFPVALPRGRRARLRFAGNDSRPLGRVVVTTYRRESHDATLVVTADATP
ncbi:MAG: hypothetical protein ABEJ70_01425 [Halobacteriaceae archaeon]